MLKAAAPTENIVNLLSLGWGKAVESCGKKPSQTFNLITYSTVGLLNISHAAGIVRGLGSGFAQQGKFFAHINFANLPLGGLWFCSFSPSPINTNKLIKD